MSQKFVVDYDASPVLLSNPLGVAHAHDAK